MIYPWMISKMIASKSELIFERVTEKRTGLLITCPSNICHHRWLYTGKKTTGYVHCPKCLQSVNLSPKRKGVTRIDDV